MKIKCGECHSILKPEKWVNPGNTIEGAATLRRIVCPVCAWEWNIPIGEASIERITGMSDVKLLWTLYHRVTPEERLEMGQ